MNQLDLLKKRMAKVPDWHSSLDHEGANRLRDLMASASQLLGRQPNKAREAGEKWDEKAAAILAQWASIENEVRRRAGT